MDYRTFGSTGFKVSVLSFGAGNIGSPLLEETAVARLLNFVLDKGINLIDTARSYGESESRIGKYLSHRRHEFILSTKVGYSFHGKADWSYDATMGTVDEALVRLQTDYLDIVHLHSCDKMALEQGDSILALERAKELGKLRVIAYSGENDPLAYAIASNRLGSIQCSVNIFDQHGIDRYVQFARDQGMGVIAKRPIGNAVWQYHHRPEGHGHAIYWDRLKQMEIDLPQFNWSEIALRFTAYTPGVDTIIAGTSSIEHLNENIKKIEEGPLDIDVYNMIRTEFSMYFPNCDGLI